MIHVYTGKGKGKTTAAIGLAVRAAGHGKKVKIIQFMKGWAGYGELEGLRRTGSISVEQFGGEEMVCRRSPSTEDTEMAKRGLEAAAGEVRSGACDMLVLDEINVAIDFKLIEMESVLEMLRRRPEGMEIILTGRNAPWMLVEMADYVTEMTEVKHPYRKGVEAREGIEY